jgi:hypothetical protein
MKKCGMYRLITTADTLHNAIPFRQVKAYEPMCHFTKMTARISASKDTSAATALRS